MDSRVIAHIHRHKYLMASAKRIRHTKSDRGTRAYCFTLNNYTNADITVLKSLDFVYLVFGYEVGESGTPHLQGYFYLQSCKSLSATINYLCSNKYHLEPAVTVSAAIAYCKKGGDYFERGKILYHNIKVSGRHARSEWPPRKPPRKGDGFCAAAIGSKVGLGQGLGLGLTTQDLPCTGPGYPNTDPTLNPIRVSGGQW